MERCGHMKKIRYRVFGTRTFAFVKGDGKLLMNPWK